MGKQIIKQPDGRFALFSSNTGTLWCWDATAEELMGYVEQFALETAERVRENYRRALVHVVAGNPKEVYAQFVRSRAGTQSKWRRVMTRLFCDGCGEMVTSTAEGSKKRLVIEGFRADGMSGARPLPDNEFHWCAACSLIAFRAVAAAKAS